MKCLRAESPRAASASVGDNQVREITGYPWELSPSAPPGEVQGAEHGPCRGQQDKVALSSSERRAWGGNWQRRRDRRCQNALGAELDRGSASFPGSAGGAINATGAIRSA